MPVVEYHFRLLVVDGQDVLLLPAKGEPRRLPKREAEHALRFLGLLAQSNTHKLPERIKELAKPLDDASPKLSRTQFALLKLLGKNADSMTTIECYRALSFRDTTTANALKKLYDLELVSRNKRANNKVPYIWQITSKGIDVLAALSEE